MQPFSAAALCCLSRNVYHYGDASAPSWVDTLLMNGIVYQYGHRYRVQKLDVRSVEDLGVPVCRLPAQWWRLRRCAPRPSAGR